MSDEPAKVQLETPDLAAAKRTAFEALFPGVVADGVLDAGRLAEFLDIDVAPVADGRERYGLMWAGKQDAVRSLLSPSRAGLAPDIDKSMNFDSAENLYIEGDNLEVLKLMQKAYNDRIKLIYIDPPYNTGNDFVYVDNYADSINKYLQESGQLDSDGNRLSAKVESGGRRHSRWLSMMYPRLVLARNLLTQDGVFLCSINDVELSNLTLLLREVFGEENYLATFVWVNEGHIEQQSRIKVNHEYILAFARDESCVGKPTVVDLNLTEDSKLFNERVENSITKNGPANPASTVTLPPGFPASADSFRVEARDNKYPHILDPIVVEDGRLLHAARLHSGWSSRRLLDLFIANGFHPIDDAEGKKTTFVITPTGAIYIQKIRGESQSHMLTVLRNMGTTQSTSSRLKRDWGVVFDFPKPEALIQYLVAAFTGKNDTVLDFFAGSGTTAHAVALQNAADGGRRRVISVNIPESVDPQSVAGQAGFANVSDICLKRIRTVLNAINGAKDLGLRVLRLSRSSFRHTESVEHGVLVLQESTLQEAPPTWNAVASEVLLKEGVCASSPWSRTPIAGGEIISSGDVSVVLTTSLSDEAVEAALAMAPRVVVFLEDGFAGSDALKANAFTKAKNAGIAMKTV